MIKKTISIFFSIIFLGIISAPSIIMTIDDTIDISVLYSLCEEEEETKNLEIFVPDNDDDGESLHSSLMKENSGYYFNKYPKPHLNLIFPPPEQTV